MIKRNGVEPTPRRMTRALLAIVWYLEGKGYKVRRGWPKRSGGEDGWDFIADPRGVTAISDRAHAERVGRGILSSTAGPRAPRFSDWLNKTPRTDDAVGDFVADWRADRNKPKRVHTLYEVLRYLDEETNACPNAVDAAHQAWVRYAAEVERR
jgi:hypothetical protein